MKIERFNSGRVVPPTVPFPEGVRVGHMLYLSGQLGNVPGQLKLVEGGLRAEARQTLENIRSILRGQGLELQHLVRDGHQRTSSSQLGALLGFSDAQVRKDLAYFGHFGHPGIGYRCDDLIKAIRKILGTDRDWPVAMIGTGNLGRALLGYKGFSHQGFRIAAAFDVDPQRVGATIEGQGKGPQRRIEAMGEESMAVDRFRALFDREGKAMLKEKA